jgi:hypothetical protein
VQTDYSGFNVEYLGFSRTLTIHCYFARAWIWRQTPSALEVPTTALLLVPTSGIPPGSLAVVLDDRIEHLIGDETTEAQIGTATIA